MPFALETSIAITFLVVNLSRLLRQFLSLYLSLLFNSKTIELNQENNIKKNYVYNQNIAVKIIDGEENCLLKAA
ncbi:hypothetical protein AsFPU3_0519 [Aphanothece sacrum FPU3]|nr:hypothetical protein AsFPU3_0519 [Aphanothece sacrum FPU3]